MSKELADSIVIAAHKMEHNEVEVISIIHYNSNAGRRKYQIYCPEIHNFPSFADAYNYLSMEGYHKVSQDEETRIKISFEVDEEAD
jgi:hypothetical protein